MLAHVMYQYVKTCNDMRITRRRRKQATVHTRTRESSTYGRNSRAKAGKINEVERDRARHSTQTGDVYKHPIVHCAHIHCKHAVHM